MDVPSPVVTIMADARSSSVRSASQLGQMTEIRQELHQKLRENDNVDTSAHNSLTNFEHKARAVTGNGNDVNLLK